MRVFISLLFLVGSVAHAVEDICPTGSSPRSDIVACEGFDVLTNCTTGEETACRNDNDGGGAWLDDGRGKFYIVTDAAKGCAQGAGCVAGKAPKGGTGSGYLALSSATDWNNLSTAEAEVRYYMKFADGLPEYETHHGPYFGARTSGGCVQMGTLEISRTNPYKPGTINCGGSNSSPIGLYLEDAAKNDATAISNWTSVFGEGIHNGLWYRINERIKLDTSCTDVTAPDGCNGEYRLWINGTLVIKKTDINFGAVDGVVDRVSMHYGPRSYYHARIPQWLDMEDHIYFDGMVASDCSASACSGDTPAIGAASNEAIDLGSRTSVGTFYSTYMNLEPYAVGSTDYPNTRAVTSDCHLDSERWSRNTSLLPGTTSSAVDAAASFVTEQNRALYSYTSDGGLCAGDTRSLKLVVPTTETVAVQVGIPTKSSHSDITMSTSKVSIYLPSSGNTFNNLPEIMGFGEYDNTLTNNRNNFFVTISNGNWGFGYFSESYNSGTKTLISESSTPVALDSWNDLEFQLRDDDTASLWVNATEVLSDVTTPESLGSDLLDTGGEGSWLYYGVLRNDESGSLTVYFDDFSYGTMSLGESCDGWSSDCPFSISGGGGSDGGLGSLGHVIW